MWTLNFYNVEAARQTSPNSKIDWKVGVDFLYGRNKDIVCKGGIMFAFWYQGRWNTNEYDLMTLVDNDVMKKFYELKEQNPETRIAASLMSSNKSNIMKQFKEYSKLSPQSEVQFNTKILFSEDKIKKSDYATTQLSYTPKAGPTAAFDELCDILYDPQELEKILWFMGALLTNNMKHIQKFLYLYGGKGTGKGTILKVFKLMFESYWAPINLSNLTSDNDFATGEIKEVPLLIDDDADLSSIKRDTNLLKLTAHEPLIINTKYKQTYPVEFQGLLITASNQRYKVRNVDSGITRRAVVAVPTNKTHSHKDYINIMDRIPYELPMIAQRAIDLFNERGVSYYEDYVDYDMIEATDYFYGFVRDNSLMLGDPCSLKKASELYKLFLDDMGYESTGYKRKVKNELKRYYNKFYDAKKIDGYTIKNVFEDFKWEIVFPDKSGSNNIKQQVTEEEVLRDMNLREQESIFDNVAKTYQAQLATPKGTPYSKWDIVTTTLADIDTKELHYVRLPDNHIIIDFDLKDDTGEKDLLENLKAVSKYPPTYTELSKSGRGVHLHYIYDGDVSKLEDHVDDNIEIKVYKGKSSLRRMLTKCNDLEIEHISTGLPIKEDTIDMYEDIEVLHLNEKKMRKLIKGNLEKKYHQNTKPSVDFIVKIFKDAELDGIEYDLRDMRQDILGFAMSSSNQAKDCVKAISGIKFTTIDNKEIEKYQNNTTMYRKEDLYFYDIEVFPNLFVVAFKRYGIPEKTIWFNPTSEMIESLVQKPIVGFNNRRYDNHILYARMLGEDNLGLYRQSQRIINLKDGGSGMYGGAYELSYTDIYDYCSANNKKSLKKWEVELGIKHDEFELPWDKPVDEAMWPRVGEYCGNDVDASEIVFDATESDYKARGILSVLSGLSMNATTNQHTTRIVFEGDKDTESELVYTDLSTIFPGYKYEFGVSSYRGDDPKEGGYVYAEPGVYGKTPILDVTSMHPNSAIQLNAFGKYTKNFKALLDARTLIKHGNFIEAGKLFGGRLKQFLNDNETAKDLSNALKTAINSAYGLSKAGFANAFKHPKNVDNIIAKRGALFMIDLKYAVQEKGYTVAHIKTDSIKIPNGDQEIIDFVIEFGKKYGYDFEHEDTYEKFALINKSEYICKTGDGTWSATGKQTKEPYVFKRLFTKEPVEKEDLFLIKEVKEAAIYLGDTFVGKFAEVYASKTGEELFRVVDDKKSFLNGTKGHLWKLAKDYTDKDDVDISYYENMVEGLVKSINAVGDINDVID